MGGKELFHCITDWTVKDPAAVKQQYPSRDWQMLRVGSWLLKVVADRQNLVLLKRLCGKSSGKRFCVMLHVNKKSNDAPYYFL